MKRWIALLLCLLILSGCAVTEPSPTDDAATSGSTNADGSPVEDDDSDAPTFPSGNGDSNTDSTTPTETNPPMCRLWRRSLPSARKSCTMRCST